MTKKKAKGANRNRNAGHSWERTLAQKFRELGYDRCKTTRETSRFLDACKVDLDFIPFNIQAKNYQTPLNYRTTIDEVRDALTKNYPERLDLPIVVLHKKRTSKLAIMDIDDFFKIVFKLKKYEENLAENVTKEKSI